MERLRRGAAWFVLALVCAAPAVGGCQGPWAWGFLLAGAAALAILLVLFESFRAGAPGGLPGQLFRRPLIGLTLPALALLLWATLSWYLQDQAPAGEGRPALALRSLLFAWGFAAAFVAGLSAADNPWRLRRALALLAVVGCALAAVAVSQWFGSGPDEAFGWAISRDRPSGLYTNANRFAVLISVCWACALSLFLAILLGLRSTRSRRRRLKRRIWIAVLFGVVLLLSAGVSVTLSRWTLISTATAVSLTTLVALLKRGRKGSETGFTYVSYHPEQRKEHLIKITALLFALAAPVAVVFALALTLAGRPLVNRFARIDQPDEMSRARSMRIAADLIAAKPALGWGLGGFENAFRPVQPMDMPGRWAQVHNDWLQVGVELGAPGLALAVLAALGLSWLAWRALPRTKGRIRAGFWLMLGGVTALAIPLLASIADFPLREPANGMVFFLLAGLYARRWMHAANTRARRRAPAPAWPGMLALAPLAAGFAGVVFLAGRAGCAGLESPWMGRMQPPAPRAEQRDGYRRALERSPDDPDFLYPYARVCLEILRTEGAQAPAEVRADFDAVLASMKAQNPNDYRMPWLEGERAIVEGDLASAADALDLAVERAPAYLSLRLEAATTRLNGPFAASRPMSVKANEELARILAHLRLLLKLDPTRESTFVGLLRQAGALPVEIAELWPKDDPDSALPRARYWAALRNWDLLGVELKRLSNVKGNLWIAALNGRLAFERGNLELGVKEWKKALEYAAYKRDQDLERWLSAEVPTLPMPAVMALYQDALKETGGLPQFALVVTARLVQDRKLAAADAVLLQASQRAARPEIFRAWAELALKLGDRDGAFSRARTAVQMSGHAQEWRAWLKAFEEQNRN